MDDATRQRPAPTEAKDPGAGVARGTTLSPAWVAFVGFCALMLGGGFRQNSYYDPPSTLNSFETLMGAALLAVGYGLLAVGIGWGVCSVGARLWRRL